jgi:hypothetical protein
LAGQAMQLAHTDVIAALELDRNFLQKYDPRLRR